MRSLYILIAEDDDQNQAMMKLILMRRGHRVKSAWNGVQALEAVKKESFDLVFMDVQMPEMDGLEATRQIRAWEDRKRRVPIVILTGSAPSQTSDNYKAAGADTFLSKPFDMKRLELVINVIASEDFAHSSSESIYQMDGSISELPTIDKMEALSRFDGDMQMYIENLVEFMKGLPFRLDQIKRALAEQQWDDISVHAHNLKGVAANFGATQLSVLAYRLDEYSHQQQSEQVKTTFHEISQHLLILNIIAEKLISQNRP
ncbi:MAG: response regulator [Chloroflexi bacterium]|nr:response regulator [Chloroflexota bacterium]